MNNKSYELCTNTNKSIKDIIYFDESGVADLKDKQTKYFILTGICTQNSSIEKYNTYYSNLKNKYLGREIALHSHQLFYNPKEKEKLFIKELSLFLNNIPISFLVAIVNKDTLINSASKRKPGNSMDTSFKKAISIHTERGNSKESFYTKPLSSILKEISNYKFEDINRYYPLEIAYKKILEQYLYTNTTRPLEIYFEDNFNNRRLLKLTEKFKNQKSFPFYQLTGISFLNKESKCFGLELADIISFGFNLFMYKKADIHKSYKYIWKIIEKRGFKFQKDKYINIYTNI